VANDLLEAIAIFGKIKDKEINMPLTNTMHSEKESEALDKRFQRLAQEWSLATQHYSSMSAAAAHPAYKEIISLGPAVVPLLLRDLECNQNHWFFALSAITGANPIPPSAAGDIPAMVKAWLSWAHEKGISW